MRHKMKIISTNIGRMREIQWRGQKMTTGIFKEPVTEPLFLGKDGVNKDYVSDRKHHGGSDKACYLYSADHYGYWKKLYPDLNWQWGFFGENLTVEGMDEGDVKIGNIYLVGDAKVQVSQPRLPCYKLGIRMESVKAVKQFLNSPYPGVYLRTLEEGYVKIGDVFEPLELAKNSISVREVYSLFSSNKLNIELKELAINDQFLAESIKKDLKKS
jgi:MOSC domain-containing protein YiiM